MMYATTASRSAGFRLARWDMVFTIVAAAVAGNYIVTPVMSGSLFIHPVAEDFEMIGVVTIIRQHFFRGIAASKQHREE